MNRKWLRAVFCLLLACFFAGGFALESAGAEIQAGWFENEWNFMEESMDIRDGIPKDAFGTLGRIQRSGVLRVAVNPDSAPRLFEDSTAGEDGMAGADLMLARRIAERMDVKLQLIRLDATQILPSLTEDQCDLAISALRFTPGRGLSFTMSKGYDFSEEEERIGILIREDGEVSSLQDLEGRILIAQRNSIPETLGAAHIRNYLEFRRTDSAQAVYEAVRDGKADAGLVPVSTAETWLLNHPEAGLRLTEGLVFTPDEQYRGFRIAAKKGETQLIAFVNAVIDEVLGSGEYEAWLEQARKRAAELGQ